MTEIDLNLIINRLDEIRCKKKLELKEAKRRNLDGSAIQLSDIIYGIDICIESLEKLKDNR